MFRIIWNWIFGKKITKEVVMVPPVDPGEVVGTPGFYLGKVKGAYPGEMDIIKQAVNLLNQLISSPRFKEEVMKSVFTNKSGKSNEEIYDIFAKRPHTINVSMFTGSFMQNRVYKTVGYDSASDEFVHANRYFVKSEVRLASLMLHETAHAVGFSHASAREHTSIPYSMNRILESFCDELYLE